MTLIDERRLTGTILCVILILTPLNIDMYLANLCQRRNSMLGAERQSARMPKLQVTA